MTKHVLFDFDGTIGDSLPLTVKVLEEVIEARNGGMQINTDIDFWRTHSFEEIILDSNIDDDVFPEIFDEMRKQLRGRFKQVLAFKGIKSVLKQLINNGYEVAIMSSNTKANILTFLERHEWDFIPEVISGIGLTGKDVALQEYMKSKRIGKSQLVYIGDEERDIRACRRADVPIIAVEWGYDDETVLNKENPEHLIYVPEEIISTIQRVFGE